jgi:uncharacterized membrane protein
MDDASRKENANVHGRRGGRGLRPYFIVLKLICVAGFLGGLMALLAAMLAGPRPTSTADWQQRADLIGRTFRWIIVPGVTGAEIVGILLLSSIWRTLIRMRWFVVKIVLVVVGMPGLHLFMSGRSEKLQALLSASAEPALAAEVHGHLLAGAVFALGLGVVLLILGRIKPRLGQNYGRTFAKNI